MLLRFSSTLEPRSEERLRTGAGPRSIAIVLVVLVEGLLILALLTLGIGQMPEENEDRLVVVNVAPQVAQSSDEAQPERQAATARSAQAPDRPADTPPDPPAGPAPQPLPPLPTPVPSPAPQSLPDVDLSRLPQSRPIGPRRPVYGPVDRGTPAFLRDTERVGTAPNGQPLYAAAWYREPKEEMLRDYLSSASGPGWGLIACKTAPDYRVEDCVGLAEYPENSNIVRSILAAAWEFKVRPPRLGGQPQIGAWVRIRISWERR
jgi:periplasmic protein TonB